MRFAQLLFLALSVLLFSCGDSSEKVAPKDEAISSVNHFTSSDYKKQETYIEMRDGTKLWTTIYSPKDTTQDYPVLIKRTPYSCRPYGPDTIPENIMHNPKLVEAGYHFVYQDVRGRWMSEGEWENVRPPYSLEDPSKTDELTDSYDTFEWLSKNLKNYNGNAGAYGNSYPGWTTLISARCNHPSVKAVIAMAPVTNFYFEDFNRYGLFAMNYIPVMNFFGTQHNGPTQEDWWPKRDSLWIDPETEKPVSYYDYFLEHIPLSRVDEILDSTNFFWQRIKAHPNYDDFHKKRNWIQYLDDIDCHVMIAGGFNDEQNLYGNLNAYREIAKHSDKVQLLLGPWSHGHNKRRDSLYYLGNIFLGEEIAKDYQENEEFHYFEHHLKGIGKAPGFKVKLFDSGTLSWHYFEEFPQEPNATRNLYLGAEGQLTSQEPVANTVDFTDYISDPLKPVPYQETDEWHRMAPKKYFTDDQRYLNNRNDVLTWTSGPLENDLTVLGEIKAQIEFATDHEDADLYVKVIDVYPEDRTAESTDLDSVDYQGYQRLVRVGYIRGRYRETFERGKPFVPGEKTRVNVPLLEVFHTFKKGHKIMVQVQSSMFPLFDVNPQNYVDDIYKAERSDFEKAKHQIFYDSRVILPIVPH